METYYHDLIKKHPKDNFYGFKWKPIYMDKNYMKLFSYIKKKKIKIILNYRNPLDIWISQYRIIQNKNINAHYQNESKKVSFIRNIKVLMPVTNLIKTLTAYEKKILKYENLLKENKIDYLKINYEDLSNKNINKWTELLNFLHPDDIDSIKQKDKLINILNNPKYIKVTNKNHVDLISNYKEVFNLLKNTKYEKYINK